MITSHADIIDVWPSVADFARDIKVKYVTAHQMKRRNNILPAYWPAVVAAAGEREFDDVTLERLVEIKAAERVGAAE